MRFAAEQRAANRGLTRRAMLGGGLVLTLAGCNSAGIEMPNDAGGAPAPGAAPPAGGPTVGETLGTGPVRVGMILPLTQNGGPSAIGVSMRNAAQMAIDGFGGPYITLMIEDDHSSADTAAQVAQAELGAGAQLILGPVFANDVRSASAATKSAGRPMIAFSTDVTVAAPGVYLLSFLIQGYVDRVLQYAISNGKKSFAIMAPQNDYGNVAAQRFQDQAGSLNVQVVVTARYSSGQMPTAAQQVAAVQGQIDALFIPEQADAMPAVAAALGTANVKTQFLGTGVWNDARVLKLPQMQGAWFSAPDNSGFDAFAQRYKAKFNSDPARLATLAYDAVTLAAALARNGGPDPFNQAALTNISGFNGADGVFRFRADGTNERGLAVMEIADGAAKVISPAPRSFAAG
ncbi:MAG: penicillin-binding protein activator [Hyphomicrobiales bacterium]|nr:penicillin-binding protein activator [Hyphomicrobiales bacterium]MBV9906292.1 penicillin-binding protein activator [Hyphomicrobiales bacterium]